MEAVGCDNDNPAQCLKTWEQAEKKSLHRMTSTTSRCLLSWPKRLAEEMSFLEGKIFKVVGLKLGGLRDKHPSVPSGWTLTKPSELESRWFAPDGWLRTSRANDREDLISATPKDGRERKPMFFDMEKAHPTPLCEQDAYVELPGEAEVEDDECVKLIYWLCG